MQTLLFCFLSVICLKYGRATGKLYTIVPTQIPPYACSIGSCLQLTLSQFAKNLTHYVDSNTTLIVTGENHNLDVEISVANIAEFFMFALSEGITNRALIPTISCTKIGKFQFSNIGSIHIRGLKFERCSSNKFKFIHHLAIEYSTFIDSKSPLTIINCNVSMIGVYFLSNSGSYKTELSLQRFKEHSDQPLLNISVGGAVILICSTIFISNCDFEANTANFGGAIFSELNSSIIISNSHFSHNQAKGCSSGYCAGGAILVNERGIMIITESTFLNNTSDFDGGLALVINATLWISHSHSHKNTASECGGVIGAFKYSNISLNNDTVLYDNKAELDGGAVYLHQSSIIVSDSEIINNNVRRDGGAIYGIQWSSIILNNCTLTMNVAPEGNGGVLYGSNHTTVTANTCEFDANSAKSGGVVQVSLHSALNITKSSFYDNIASADGGVAHVHTESMISIRYSKLTDNRAVSDSGGVVYVEKSSTMNIRDCIIVGNTAEYGGGLDVSFNSIASIESCNFRKNIVKDNGAAIHVYINSTVIITNSTFVRNRANDSGGAVLGRRNCTILISNTVINNSIAEYSGGGVYIGHGSNIYIRDCTFLSNSADFGGAVRAYIRSNVTVIDSIFDQNRANIEGGVLHAYRNSSIIVQSSNFTFSKARSGGVFLIILECKLSFQNNKIANSSADFGGVMGLLEGSTINITGGTFTHNSAQSGGVLYAHTSKIVVEKSAIFSFNSARLFGGVIHANDDTTIIINTVTFSNNTADFGGVLSLLANSSGFIQYSDFVNSQANNSGGVVYLNDAKLTVYSSRFKSSSAFMRGGILSISSASTLRVARSKFSNGTAKLGAAMAIIERSTLSFISYLDFLTLTPSQLSVNNSEMTTIGADEILICNNTALGYGGGIYLRESSVYVGIGTNISFNKAGSFGGGIHAINSSITVKHMIHFVHNKAVSGGGGLSLRNSKLYNTQHEDIVTSMNFVFNEADNGGAIHVKDENITGICSGECTSTSGCFFQNVSEDFSINFDKNHAIYEGDDLFGGLLDRCTVSNIDSIDNQSQLQSIGIARFKSVSNINITGLKTISSKPVKVCFCENHKHICGLRSKAVEVKHRDTELAAIDQANHMILATIKSRIYGYRLPVSQATQTIDAACSNVSYHITASPRENPYEATIYADGPCGDEDISSVTVNITVLQCKCAIGLVYSIDSNNDQGCKCTCDQQLLNYHYVQNCDPDKDSVEREGVYWIAVTDTDDGNFSYLFFPYCPMGYCQSPNKLILVNLSQINGSDAQCANNHAGFLCGKCQPHYSLSLGSSKCIKCHRKWYGQLIGIIIASSFAGMFLVVIILVLNLTVAVGTLNSVIFYANIAYSGRILTQSWFSSVFISWLNLDIGFDVCFYEGMDAYTKTWLQLAFPAYVIFLVIAIIWISSRSSTFSNLIGKRDPVATLATLILISYSRFLQIIIVTFSFVKSNGSITPSTRWLYDASIVYFGWKHALIFFTAVVILICGLFYTILLFSWQWLLRCPRSKVLNWTRNQKLHSFIDTYHTPHMAKYRYWTGLLLLARVILYLISAFSTSMYADAHIPLLATIIIMSCLLLFKTVMMIKVYRNWLLNAMDSFMCFNIIIPAIFTLHSFANNNLQTKVIDAFVGITVILFCFIIAFHVYRYGTMKLYTYCQNTKICENITKWLSCIQSQERSSSSPSDGRLLDVLDSLRQDDEVYDQHEAPTSSPVSLIRSEESPSLDYYSKLSHSDEGENYQLQSNKLQERKSTSIRSHCDHTEKRPSSLIVTLHRMAASGNHYLMIICSLTDVKFNLFIF